MEILQIFGLWVQEIDLWFMNHGPLIPTLDTNIAYTIYYNFLMVLTNSLSGVASKFRSYFYVFQKMFLNFSFLHPTENLIQYPFQQAGALLFLVLWCFCLICKCSCIFNNFWNYCYLNAFKIPLMILFDNFWLCIMKLLV